MKLNIHIRLENVYRWEEGVTTILLADNNFKKNLVYVKAISTFHIDDVCCSFNNLGFSNVYFNHTFDPEVK